jgi:hypothetical protein
MSALLDEGNTGFVLITRFVVATAQKEANCGDQQIELHILVFGPYPVQWIPSNDAIARLFVPFAATATKIDRFGDQQTLFHKFPSAGVRVVHVVASGDVATLFEPTTTKVDSSADQQMDFQNAPTEAREVQVMPSGEVINGWFAMFELTAQNMESSGAQHTDDQDVKDAGVALDTHVIPSDDVITQFPVPEELTAQKNDNSLAQHTDIQLLSIAETRLTQVTPSDEVITRFPTPGPELTAQKRDSSLDQHIDCQSFVLTGDVRVVHVMLSGDVIM